VPSVHSQLQLQCIGAEAFASEAQLEKTRFWETWGYNEVLAACCQCGNDFDVGGENVPNLCSVTQKPLCCDCGWSKRHKCLPPASVLPGSVPAVPEAPVVINVASESSDAASPPAESVEVAVSVQPPASVLAVPVVVSVTALLYSFVCRICLFVL
jgi:hypothetical protein